MGFTKCQMVDDEERGVRLRSGRLSVSVRDVLISRRTGQNTLVLVIVYVCEYIRFNDVSVLKKPI